MAIHQNLKELRSARNMTQEQVAAQLNVTRQTISSYESGRTRPDVDTLARLAHLYDVSLEDILYGQNTTVSRTRWLRLCQWGTAGLSAALVLLRSVLMCVNNRLFPLANGALSDQTVMETHFRISKLWESLDGLALAAALIGFLILLCLELTRKPSISLKRRGIFLAAFTAWLLAVSVPFALADPTFSVADYVITPLLIFSRLLLVQAIALSASLIRRGNHPTKAAPQQ